MFIVLIMLSPLVIFNSTDSAPVARPVNLRNNIRFRIKACNLLPRKEQSVNKGINKLAHRYIKDPNNVDFRK